jgi:hypothetical protein
MQNGQYTKPRLREIGSVRDLTKQSFNKVGSSPDIYTVTTQGVVVGSLVPVD